jgi:hypothetical protein
MITQGRKFFDKFFSDMEVSMKKFGWMLVVLVCGLWLSGCGGEEKDLPPLTVVFEAPTDRNGDYQYYTNEPTDFAYSWYTWVTYPPKPKDTYKIRVNKISGNSRYGYGLIFAATPNSGPDKGLQSYYDLLISINRYYAIFKLERGADGKFQSTPIYPPELNERIWAGSEKLIAGYNKENTLEIRKKEGGVFDIYLNDTYDATFEDPDPLSGDRIGFIVYVGNADEESFPNTPVDIRFWRE